MASGIGKSQCATCGKEKAILKCGGCAQDFCYNHFGQHRQELDGKLEEVEVSRDMLRQTLSEQIAETQKHPLVQQIDQWENESIKKIQQTAEEARELLRQHTTAHVKRVEIMLSNLTDQLRQGRGDNDFVETDLHRWTEQLTELTTKLNNPSNISLRQHTKPLVTQLYVEIKTESPSALKTNKILSWMQDSVVVAGGNGKGNSLNQLSEPVEMHMDEDGTIYVADILNHRIVEWKSDTKSGTVVAGGNGPGKQTNQLNRPNDVIIDKKTNSLIISDGGNRRVVRWSREAAASVQIIIPDIDCGRLTTDNDGNLYISDIRNHAVKRWRMEDGTIDVVAGGYGRGVGLNQLNQPIGIFVDKDHSVYVSDWGNNRVMKWLKNAKQGTIVAAGQGKGGGLTQLSGPRNMVVDQSGAIYIADYGNNRIVRWEEGAKQGTVVVGGNGAGKEPNQLNGPACLAFDQQGNMYIVDQLNQRVLKFQLCSTSS